MSSTNITKQAHPVAPDLDLSNSELSRPQIDTWEGEGGALLVKPGMKGKAIVFSAADGRGVCIGAISEDNLENEGYHVQAECRWPETSRPTSFWRDVFQKTDYAGASMVLVVGIPPPIAPDLQDSAVKTIEQLSQDGTKVVFIDHHRGSAGNYGALRSAGAEVIVSSATTACYYGIPTNYARFWGRVAAICCCDSAVLPLKDSERELAQGVHAEVRRDPKQAYSAVIRNELSLFDGGTPDFTGRVEPLGKVALVTGLSPSWGFRQLERIVQKQDFDYAIAVDKGDQQWRLLGVSSWEREPLPIALSLGLQRFTGTASAIKVKVAAADDPQGLEKSLALAREYAAELNREPACTQPKQDAPIGQSDVFKFIARFMREVEIPYFLTQHGWPHVERVVGNIRSIGSLLNVTGQDQKLLDFAALLHDVGNGASTIFGVSDDEARERHHEFGLTLIRDWAKLGVFRGVLNETEVEQAADLVYRHRKKMPLPEDKHARFPYDDS